jgi:hypothetical protein
MPATKCPPCSAVNELPDDWPHPSYKCPHCESTVAVAAKRARVLPPDSAPPPVPARPTHTTHMHHAANPLVTGCGVGFGWVVGSSLAGLVLLFMMCGGCAVVLDKATPTSSRK